MRFTRIVLLISALVLTASAAHAGTWTFGIGGGIASPTGDFGDVAKMGWDINTYADYWVKPNTAIGIDIDGSFYGGKDDYTNGIATIANPDPSFSASLIGYGVHGILAFPMENSKMQPWITGGLGMYSVAAKLEEAGLANFDDSDSDFGFHLGGGLDWATRPTMKFGVDAKYHMVQTEGDATNYFTAGVHLTFTTSGGQ